MIRTLRPFVMKATGMDMISTTEYLASLSEEHRNVVWMLWLKSMPRKLQQKSVERPKRGRPEIRVNAEQFRLDPFSQPAR